MKKLVYFVCVRTKSIEDYEIATFDNREDMISYCLAMKEIAKRQSSEEPIIAIWTEQVEE